MTDNISIIIPSFRRKDSLLRLLSALQRQVMVSAQILVVDQNEHSFWTEEEKKQYFTNITFLYQKKANVAAARNYGAAIAANQYLLFIDDDLVPDENFCKNGLHFFKYNEVKAFCPTVYGYEGVEEASAQYKKKHTQSTHPNVFPIEETLSACLFFEKAYFLKTGGFDPVLFDYAKSTEDQELFKRMQKRNMNFYHCDSLVIFHDDKTAGGCDLRSEDYWTSRYKFMKGWAYRHAMHNKNVGHLNFGDYFKMIRSAFLNKEGLKQGVSFCSKQFNLLLKAIKETKSFLQKQNPQKNILDVNFFNSTNEYL